MQELLYNIATHWSFALIAGACGIAGMIASIVTFFQAKSTKQTVDDNLKNYQTRKKLSEEIHSLKGALASISDDNLTIGLSLANILRRSARSLLILGQKDFDTETMSSLHQLVDATTPYYSQMSESESARAYYVLNDALVDTIARLEKEDLKSEQRKD